MATGTDVLSAAGWGRPVTVSYLPHNNHRPTRSENPYSADWQLSRSLGKPPHGCMENRDTLEREPELQLQPSVVGALRYSTAPRPVAGWLIRLPKQRRGNVS